MTFLKDYAVSVGKAWWFVAVTILLTILQAVLIVILLLRGSQPTPIIPWVWLVVLLLLTIVVAQGFAAYKLWSQIPRDDPKLLVAKDAIRKMATAADRYANKSGVDGIWVSSWLDDTIKSLTKYLGEDRASQLNVFVNYYRGAGIDPAGTELTRGAASLRKLADEIIVDDLDTFYRYGNN